MEKNPPTNSQILRVAVISDSHLEDPSEWFSTLYGRHLAEADVLLHCGDITGWQVLHFLDAHPRFHAVAGNMDTHLYHAGLPGKLELELNGLRVGIAHGWGFGYELAREVVASFGPGFDLVFFGHTHIYECTRFGNTTALNPGSCRAPRGGTEPSFALVTLGPERSLAVERIVLPRKW